MFSSSIVLYKTDLEDITKLVNSLRRSAAVKVIYLIDNSPVPCIEPPSEPDIIFFHRPDNPGYGAGHNIAMRHAISQGYAFHLVVNPDISFEPSVLHVLLGYIEEDDRVMQLMPEVVDPEGRLQYLCKAVPTPLNLFVRRFSFFPFGVLHDWLDEKYTLRFWDHRSVEEIPILSGCFMVLRLSAVETVGYFDEGFFMYLEDFDLTRRLGKLGKTMYIPHVRVIHRHEKASYRGGRMLHAHIRSAIRYFGKWGWFFDVDRKKSNQALFRRLRSN